MSNETNSGISALAPPARRSSRGFGSAHHFPDGRREDPKLGRAGAPWPRHVAVLAVLLAIAACLLRVVGDVDIWILHRAEVLIAVTGIACWRWGWFALQNLRAVVYRYLVWPRLQRAAASAIAEQGPVPEVIVLATTYHEKPWITERVFDSIFLELQGLEGLTRRPKLLVVTGCDADDENIRKVYARWCPEPASVPGALWPVELVLLRGDKGKRPALALGMEEIARGNPAEDGVVIILDGDTMLQTGLLAKVLPIFRLSPTVHAATTNETGLVNGPAWFAEWTSLRFGLRHRSMCSVSLSGKLLCLTGRFSAFRASVACDPTFRTQVEHDVIEHWLWGSFEMLSGDDKSTWYWLSAHGKRMLYVPDAYVTTFEVITGSSLERAMANVRRWSGNSVRHSWRAIKLGPRKLGFFAWWCLIDQRITTVTVLFGPTVALLAILAGRYEMVAGYLLWVLCSRLAHAAIACRQGRRLSAYYVPLQVVSDWVTALTKLWVVFHPAKQNWLNRGARTLNTTKGSAFYSLRSSFAHYLYAFSCAAVVIGIGLFTGFLPLAREAHLFLNPHLESDPEQAVPANSLPNRQAALETRAPLPASISPPSHVSSADLIRNPWMALDSADAKRGAPRRNPQPDRLSTPTFEPLAK